MRFLLLPLLVFIVSFVGAQTVYQRVFNVQNGLAQSQVYALYQDTEGILWIGTAGGGLNRYNGKAFENITTTEGLAGNGIFSITGNERYTFVGTDKGLSVFKGKVITNYTVDNGLTDNKIWKVEADKSGKVYIGTAKGVSVYENGKISALEIDSVLAHSAVHAIIIDKKGNVWFGTKTNGLFKYDGKKVRNFGKADSLTNTSVRSLCEDSQGRIWIGAEQGYFLYDGKVIHKSNVNFAVLSIWPADDGKVWIAAFQEMLGCYSLQKENHFTVSDFFRLKNLNIRTMLIDSEKSIWLGTETGLVQIPFRNIINYNTDHGLQNNNVFGIGPGLKSGEYWIGADANGVSSFNEAKNKDAFLNFNTNNNKLIGSNVYALLKDSRKRIWMATFNGITVFDIKDSVFTHYTNLEKDLPPNTIIVKNMSHKAFFCLYEDFKEQVWAGSVSGVTLFTDTGIVNFNEIIPDLKGSYVYCITQDKLGTYWFATNAGAITWNGKKIIRFNAENGFVDGRVNSIDQDKFGNFWFATKEGVFIYNGYEFKKIDKTNGLSSNNLYSLKYDGNQYIYIGTDKGLDRIDAVSYKQIGDIQISHYGLHDGFVGVECNLNSMYIDSAGRVLVGTVEGFNIFDPRREQKNGVVPRTKIVNIFMNLKEFDFTPYCSGFDSLTGLPINLKLPYNLNYLSFVFSSNSLLVPDKVLFKYRMVGVDNEWTPPKSRTDADFPTLQPGKYSFEVISCNNDGVWSDNPSVFSFEIMPPFYLTWWFITSAIVFVLVVIFLAIKYREANLRKEKQILEQRVQERTYEIERQKNIVEEKNKDITDSINYAKNIQEALLPARKEVMSIFPDCFVIYRPRDIVSGDYYWIAHKGDRTYFAVADCTGHGVPGAFMSLLGIAFLDEIIAAHPDIAPSQLMNMLRDNVTESFKNSGSKDGMDMSLIMVEWKTRKLYYSGANNPLYFVRNNVLKEIKPQKMPIGYYPEPVPFEQHELELSAGDTVYLFSDGMADQFGGPLGKKYKYKTLRELLTSVGYLPMVQQKDNIEKSWLAWKGDYEQVDDNILIGIRFSEQTLDNPDFK